ncbi:MAG: hypothetical protein AAFX50_18995, partial [Acidobacteriota bacterium]
VTDGGGFLIADEFVLQPFYDTLLVHSSVWTDVLDLELEYREVSLTGLPSGPWVEGLLQPAAETTGRSFCTRQVSLAGDDCFVIEGDVLAFYWEHPELPLVPYEVRLRASNRDGQEITSPVRLFRPEVPLIIEYLGVDADGDQFRVTNASNAVVRDITLALRTATVNGDIAWAPSLGVVNRLLPGEFIEFDSGCAYVDDGGGLVRAQGTGSLGEEAVSLPTAIPPREGFSELSGVFFSGGSCATGNGRGLFGAEQASPCGEPLLWPRFWVTNGAPAAATGRVPVDPTGVPFERYELLLDGITVLEIGGPLQTASYQELLDFSAFGEGFRELTERYTYSGEPGLLGSCPQRVPVRIDRTPPVPTITAPVDGALICPDDLMLDITIEVDDAGPVNHRATVAGAGTGDAACSPYSGPGGTFSLAANDLPPGIHELVAEVRDQAGYASCTSINVIVPELPNIGLGTSPPI